MGVVSACVLSLLICGQLMENVEAQSLSRLRARLRQTLGHRKQVEQKLKNVKAEQATARHQLSKVQKELDEARARLSAARRKVARIESDLHKVKAEKEKTEKCLAAHSEATSERLLAMYEVGAPSYLEVVLNATDFEDFANRAEFTRLVARQDESLLSELAEAKKKLTEQKAIIEDYRQQQIELTKQVQYQAALVDKRKRDAAALVQKTNRDRAAAESEHAALLEAAQDMAALIKQVQRGHGGARYTGKWSGHFLTPVQGRITSRFGWRIHPVWHTRRFHDAIDIAAPTGTSIKAADKGLVIHSGWWGAYGKCIIVDHGSGWSTRYGHCSSLLVKKGDIVARGSTIGRVGSTGVSTGPHLDWAVLKNGTAVNPQSL